LENQFSSKDELIRELNLLRQRNQELEKKASQLEANFNAFPDGITMLDRNAALDLMNTANILSQVFDSITDGVFALDIHWRFQFVNKQAAEYLGVLPEDLMGVNFFEKFPDFAGYILEEKFCFVKDTWQVEIFEMQIIYKRFLESISLFFHQQRNYVLCTDITNAKC
jgi:PAS domain-containing protein